MTLIKSISGIRGTIGGISGNALTPMDVVKYTAAFTIWAKDQEFGSSKHNIQETKRKIVIGRDARISGSMVRDLVCGTLVSMGIDVIDLGLSTTPTVEMAVACEKAIGGIIITASHNPKEWNALKLLNYQGEFVSEKEGEAILNIAERNEIQFSEVDYLGRVTFREDYLDFHIAQILKLPLVKVEAIKKANFSVVLDAVNSTGGIFVPLLLRALGVKTIVEINCTPNGQFNHNPEPLPQNLIELAESVKTNQADIGIAVDPDVDRLVFINEDGSPFGEEYTLVAVSDYVLQHTPGDTVSNLSSTRALQDITQSHGGSYYASAVGEVNVVEKMKDTNAVIGGEGNGGIIYPDLHYGRDALVGIALFLSHLALSRFTIMSELRKSYPSYFLSKNKVDLTPTLNVEAMMIEIKKKYGGQPILDIDGLRIDFEKSWVHLRKSNTEPILRIYAESSTQEAAQRLADTLIEDIRNFITSRP